MRSRNVPTPSRARSVNPDSVDRDDCRGSHEYRRSRSTHRQRSVGRDYGDRHGCTAPLIRGLTIVEADERSSAAAAAPTLNLGVDMTGLLSRENWNGAGLR